MPRTANKAKTETTTTTRSTSSRAGGEGTYYKDGADFCWRLRKGPRNAQKTIAFVRESSSERRKIAVRKKLAELEATGILAKAGDPLTVTQSLNLWLDGHVQGRREDTTTEKYRGHSVHIIAAIGKMQAKAVDAAAMQKVVDHSIGLGHEPGTTRSIIRCCCTCLGLSIRDLQKRDVAANKPGLNLPPEPEARDRVLDLETEVEPFLDELFRTQVIRTRARVEKTVPVYRDRYLIALLINTGLRISEALGTMTMLVSLRDEMINVEKQLKRRKKKGGGVEWYLGPLKGKHSRKVPLNSVALELIRSQIKMIEAEKEAAGPGVTDHGLLFPTGTGEGHSRHNVTRTLTTIQERINEARAKAGLEEMPHFTLHDLRRTYATHLAAVEDKIQNVASILGHAKIETTMKHYVHAQEKGLRVTAAKISFGRGKAS